MGIADVPRHKQALFERVAVSLPEPPLGMWSGYDNNTDSLVVVLTVDALQIVRPKKQQAWLLDDLEELHLDWQRLTVEPAGRERSTFVYLDAVAAVHELAAVYPRANLGCGDLPPLEGSAAFAAPPSVAADMVTTLSLLPGHVITRVFGVVSELTSASGWTAESKGNSALARAMANIRVTAAELTANAIVGLTATTFGAHGGITSVVGGDAVGVLLMGTAVTVEPASPEHR